MSKNKEKTAEELLQEALVPKEEQPYPIPKNWVWVKLGAITKLKSGNSLGIEFELLEGQVPYVKVADMNILENNKEIVTSSRFVNFSDKIKNALIPPRSIIFPKRGGAISTNKKRIVNSEIVCDLNIMAIICPDELNFKYLYYWFLNIDLESLNNGSSVPQINNKDIFPLAFPVAPILEQKRIADKVERLLNKINQAKQLIKEAKETFELRRAAILDKAFRGELTSKWRRAKLEEEDTVEDLLSSISNMKLKKPQKISEHFINNLFNADFPDTWKMVKLEDLFNIVGGGTPSKSVIEYWTGDIPWVSPKDMKTLWVNSSLDKISREAINNSSVNLVKKGSVALVVRSGILQRTLPVAMLMQESTVNQDMKVFDSGIEYVNRFFMWYIVAYEKLLLKEYTKSGTTVNSIEFDKFKGHSIPLPPLSEVKEILEIIETQMVKQDEVNKKLQMSEDLENLKQSILSKAFRGELGTSDCIEESSLNSIKQL